MPIGHVVGRHDPGWTGAAAVWFPVWLAGAVVIAVRSSRTRVVVSPGLVSRHATYATLHLPTARIAGVGCSVPQSKDATARSSGDESERRLVVDDGRQIRFDHRWMTSKPDGRSLHETLDGLVAGARPDGHRSEPAIYPVTRRGRWLTAILVVLAFLAAASLMWIDGAGWVQGADGAAAARTARQPALVMRVHHVADERATKVVVRLDAVGDAPFLTLWEPERSRLRVEDAVDVAYDPGDPDNVALAHLPPVDSIGARVLLFIAVPTFVGSAIGALVLAVVLGGWAQRARRLAVTSVAPPSTIQPVGPRA